MIRERTCLYRMYDAVGALLYVGITNRPDLRFKQHAADKPWWREVKRITKVWYDVRECVSDLTERHCVKACAGHSEISAIIRERPRYNIEHNLSNPHRVRYRKLDAPSGPLRARRKRRKARRMDARGWAWLVTCALLMALTTAVGVWAGVLGLGGIFGSRYVWRRWGVHASESARMVWRGK